MRIADLERLLRPIRRRITAALSRGVWRQSYQDEAMLKGQVSTRRGELLERLEAPQPYGLASRPLPGAEAFTAQLGGVADHVVVLVVEDRRFRLRLSEGEVALYDHLGNYVIFKADGRLAVRATEGLDLEGDLRVTGSITATEDVSDGQGSLDELRQGYDVHRHHENGTGGGVTDPPIPQV